MNKIIKYVTLDILRNRTIVFYTLFLAVISFSLFSFDDHPSKGLLSLMNLVLLIVPLMSIIFSTIYIYNCSEFVELLVCQPLQRKYIWLSLFAGLALSLTLAFFIGCGSIVLFYHADSTGIIMILTGCLLTLIFVAIAMLATVGTRDKARGIGKSILLWLYFAVIFDGLVLFLLFQFADYPLEKAMMVLSTLNPIDLSRVLMLLQLDVSALMGFTGAVFRQFFGTSTGLLVSISVLILWMILPLWRSVQRFNHKDL